MGAVNAPLCSTPPLLCWTGPGSISLVAVTITGPHFDQSLQGLNTGRHQWYLLGRVLKRQGARGRGPFFDFNRPNPVVRPLMFQLGYSHPFAGRRLAGRAQFN